jgi:hypothetical protein
MSRKNKKRHTPPIPPLQAAKAEIKPLSITKTATTAPQSEIARDIETLTLRFHMKVVTN